MIYLSGVSRADFRAELPTHDMGQIWTPQSWRAKQHVPGAHWAADNGCFTLGDKFDPDKWMAWLAKTDPTHCLFSVAPDVVGDAAATLERSAPYYVPLRAAGFKPAFVLQNGQEHLPVPWDDIDAVFIGGDDEWKLGRHACALAYQAKDRNKWVHMGRVNSHKRLRRAALMGCDSADGTFLRWGSLERMKVWLRELNYRPVLDLENL